MVFLTYEVFLWTYLSPPQYPIWFPISHIPIYGGHPLICGVGYYRTRTHPNDREINPGVTYSGLGGTRLRGSADRASADQIAKPVRVRAGLRPCRSGRAQIRGQAPYE